MSRKVTAALLCRPVTAFLTCLGLLTLAILVGGPMVSPAMAAWQFNQYNNGAYLLLRGLELGSLALFGVAYALATIRVARLHQNHWLIAMGIGLGFLTTGFGAIVTFAMLIAYIIRGPSASASRASGAPTRPAATRLSAHPCYYLQYHHASTLVGTAKGGTDDHTPTPDIWRQDGAAVHHL